MIDQAAVLRQRVERFRNQNQTKVISVFSGKGGVGKSIFSVNFSIALCQLGKKVVLVDLDIGMANIDILLGLSAKSNISQMLNDRLPIETIIETGPDGLAYIAGGNGLSELFKMDEIKFSYFFSQLSVLSENYDYIIFDFGAGITSDMLNFMLASHEGILVTTTEPTSTMDAYAMIKTINRMDQSLPIRLVINRCENYHEGEMCQNRLQKVTKIFLKKDISLLGFLSKDRTVEKTVKSQKPFIVEHPHSMISIEIKRIAKLYIGLASHDYNPRNFTYFLSRLRQVILKKDG